VADDFDPNPQVTFSPASVSTAAPANIVVTYTATDSAGNAASVTRQFIIGDGGANTDYTLHGPATMNLFKGSSNGVVVSGRIKIPGLTDGALAASNVICDIGIHTANTDPATWGTNVWKRASLATEWTGNDYDEHRLLVRGIDVPQTNGTYYYAARWQFGGTNLYGGITEGGAGGKWDGTIYANGVLTLSSADAFSDWLGSAPNSEKALAEYAFGANTPGSLNPAFQPKLNTNYANFLTIEYHVREGGMSNITVRPQFSTNLTTGRAGFVDVEPGYIQDEGPVSVLPGETQVRKFLVGVPIETNSPRMFLHLKILRTTSP